MVLWRLNEGWKKKRKFLENPFEEDFVIEATPASVNAIKEEKEKLRRLIAEEWEFESGVRRLFKEMKWEQQAADKPRVNRPKIANAAVADIECPRCSSSMSIKTNRNDGSKFYGCSCYPECSGAISIEPEPESEAKCEAWRPRNVGSLPDIVEAFLNRLSKSGASLKVCLQYEGRIAGVCSFLKEQNKDIETATTNDLKAYFSNRELAASSVPRVISVLHQFYGFLVSEGKRSDDPTMVPKIYSIYPINFYIEYASGRVEHLIAEEQGGEYLHDLRRLMELGAVRWFVFETYRERKARAIREGKEKQGYHPFRVTEEGKNDEEYSHLVWKTERYRQQYYKMQQKEWEHYYLKQQTAGMERIRLQEGDAKQLAMQRAAFLDGHAKQ